MASRQGPSLGKGLDGFNRALAIVIAGALSAGAVLAALVTPGVIDPSLAPGGWVRDQMRELAGLNGVSAIGAFSVFIAGAIGGLLLLAAELTPLVRQPYMSAGNGTDREFAVQERAVEQMVCYAGQQVEYVVAVEDARVSRDEHGLEVACKVVLEPYAAAGAMAPLLEARIRNAVYTMTGLSVGRVRLRIRHAEGERQAV